MKKILVLDLPENVTEVSVSYSNLLGVKFAGRVKAHCLPSPPKDLLDTCIVHGWKACIKAIEKLSDGGM